MVVPRYQNVGQNHYLLIDNKSFENVTEFKGNGNETELHSQKL